MHGLPAICLRKTSRESKHAATVYSPCLPPATHSVSLLGLTNATWTLVPQPAPTPVFSTVLSRRGGPAQHCSGRSCQASAHHACRPSSNAQWSSPAPSPSSLGGPEDKGDSSFPTYKTAHLCISGKILFQYSLRKPLLFPQISKDIFNLASNQININSSIIKHHLLCIKYLNTVHIINAEGRIS